MESISIAITIMKGMTMKAMSMKNMTMKAMSIAITIMKSMVMKATITKAMTTATITITAKAAAAAADMIMTTMITIMRTRCSPAGEPKRLHPTRGMRFPISWKRWRMRRNTASYSVQRAWYLQGTEPGYTLIMCPARAM